MKRALAALLLLASAPGVLTASPSEAPLALDAEVRLEDAEASLRPPVVFRVRPAGPAAFLPGRDPRAGVTAWQIQIFDFDNRKVDFIQGVGRPPARDIPWSAVGPDGAPLHDGFYTARLVWRDRAGRTTASEPVKVGLLAPQALRRLETPGLRLAYSTDGLTIRLAEELTFEPGQWRIRPDSFESLEKVAEFLIVDQGERRLVVSGHTDSTGADAANQALSLKRARAISDYLVKRGVAPARVSSLGLGASSPVASNASPDGRRRNRRVDILVLATAG